MWSKICGLLLIVSVVAIQSPATAQGERNKITDRATGEIIWTTDSQSFYFEGEGFGGGWFEYDVETEKITRLPHFPFEIDDTFTSLSHLNPLLPQEDKIPLVHFSPNGQFAVYASTEFNKFNGDENRATIALANLETGESVSILANVYPFQYWMFTVFWSEDSTAFVIKAHRFNYGYHYYHNFTQKLADVQEFAANDLETDMRFMDEVGVVYDILDINQTGDKVLLNAQGNIVIWEPLIETVTVFEIEGEGRLEDASFIDDQTIWYIKDGLYQIDVETKHTERLTDIPETPRDHSETLAFAPNGCYLLSLENPQDDGWRYTLYFWDMCSLIATQSP